MPAAIIVENVTKTYYKYKKSRSWTLQDAILKNNLFRKQAEQFNALNDVNFTVPKGHTMGVIGHNGAGKSTLFKIVGGLSRPDQGKVRVKGKIGALLDLGAGFQNDLTGRENIYINGVISGLRRKEVEARFDSIVDFAEIEDFLDNPLHTYSSGMRMRLGFSVATHINPEILLIDEVLAVGDMAFQQKCFNRIMNFKENGCTILLVSHQIHFIKEYADSALWLDHGSVKGLGAADEVVTNYINSMNEKISTYNPKKSEISSEDNVIASDDILNKRDLNQAQEVEAKSKQFAQAGSGANTIETHGIRLSGGGSNTPIEENPNNNNPSKESKTTIVKKQTIKRRMGSRIELDVDVSEALASDKRKRHSREDKSSGA